MTTVERTTPDLEIVTDGRGMNDWVVKAEWLGAIRVVHRGDIFSCIAYAQELCDG